MKKYFIIPLALLALTACGGDDKENDEPTPGPDVPAKPAWHQIWVENFNTTTLNESLWSRLEPYNPPSSGPDWRKFISAADPCFEFTGSSLKLKGIVTPDGLGDDRPYICGGITTNGKFNLEPPFRIEIRAKLTNAQGAWPAIWMMPVDGTGGWPKCGEIDIMEHLNSDTFVYQTVHSAVSGTYGGNSVTATIKPGEYNTYGLAVTENAIAWFVNGEQTFRYNRVAAQGPDQFPFYKDQYLKIDMQLGGSWVGYVEPDDLPVEMEIDWVKYSRYY